MNWFDRWAQNIGPGQAIFIAMITVALMMTASVLVERWVNPAVRAWILNVLVRGRPGLGFTARTQIGKGQRA